MLAMMFNYINEETVMATTESRLVSCWKPLYLGERRVLSTLSVRRCGERGKSERIDLHTTRRPLENIGNNVVVY